MTYESCWYVAAGKGLPVTSFGTVLFSVASQI